MHVCVCVCVCVCVNTHEHMSMHACHYFMAEYCTVKPGYKTVKLLE